MSASSSLVYFVLGTPGSGRRGLVSDLIENGLAPTQRALVLLAGSEPAAAADPKLAALGNVEVRRWRWAPPELPAMEGTDSVTIFFLADSRASFIDQLEALKPWLEQHGARLARILCVVDCQLAEKHPALLPWFDACIHFADVVFLTRREGVTNKWLSGFIKRFKGGHYPCHLLQPRNGEVDNPALVLEPEARRVTDHFDETVALTADDIEGDDDVELTPEDFVPPIDPYFERNRSGRRVKEFTDVRKFLPPQ